jgi:peptide/nickel transport system ATP-binding protein
MTDSIMQVENLSIGFQSAGKLKTVVKNLAYELYAGETLAIVGESGSGKSISSLALLGLLPKSAVIESGSIRLNGKDILSMNAQALRTVRGSSIAMIFQEPMTALTPVLTIGEQLIEGIRCHQQLTRQAAKELAVEMLRVTRIPEPAKRLRQYPHQLSGGMRQRVMIAMALACRPQVLIADEPTTALDVTIQAQILTLMKTLQKSYGTAIIIVTHDMGVVAETADRVMVMYRGEKVEEGQVQQVLTKPGHSYTQALLEAVPVLGKVVNAPCRKQSEKLEKPLLELVRLSVRFPQREGFFGKSTSNVHALEQVSLTLKRGETLALVGESGSGKSTLGRAVLNLVPVISGSVVFAGRDITSLSNTLMRPLRKNMQMIFQDPMASLNPRMKVGNLVAEPMAIHSSYEISEIHERTEKLFERVGLSKQDMQRYPNQFSGGQRQRICIARALATEPSLIIADECVSALDVSLQAEIIDLMKSLQNEIGVSYLFISHDLAVVEQISHRVAVMTAGRIVEIGNTQAVLHNPQHAYTRRLISAVPNANPALATLTSNPLIEGEIPSVIRPLGYEAPSSVMKSVIDSSDHHVVFTNEHEIVSSNAS